MQEKRKKLREVSKKQGTYNKATTDATINKTRGMVAAITTNVISAESGSGANKVNAPLDMWLVNDLVQKINDNGGDISNIVLLMNSTNLLQLHGDAIEMKMPIGEAYMSGYGIQIRDLILPVGTTVHLAIGEFIPAGTVLAINPSVIGPIEQPVPVKGNFFLEELAKTGAGTKYQIFGQIGLDHGPEWFHGKITGLNTTFTKPSKEVKVNVTNTTTNPVNTKAVTA